MPRKNQEQPDVPPFEYRAGVTIPALGGMYRRGDPTQIPPHRLHLGVNIRLADGEMGSRSGLAQVEGTQANACVTGIFEIEDFAVGVHIDGLADGGLTAGGLRIESPFNILSFNEEKVPVSRNFWDEGSPPTFPKTQPGPWRVDQPHATGAFTTFQRFNDALLIANGKDVYQAEFSEDDDLPRMDLTLLFRLADAGGDIASMCVRRERVDDAQTGSEFDKDVLYLGCGGGEVWRYDGTTMNLQHTLAAGGRMHVLSWGAGAIVAAGDSAAGFSYQQQAGGAWANQAWGRAFNCNGLCEFNGKVVFVGDALGDVVIGSWSAYAMHWSGVAGAPVTFASEPGGVQPNYRYRSPVVAGGAVHWLRFFGENITPPFGSSVHIARWTDFATGSNTWADIGLTGLNGVPINDYGLFVPFAGGMLFLAHSNSAGPGAQWPAGQTLMLAFSGTVVSFDVVYNWPRDAALNGRLTGLGYEAISI